MGLFVQRLFLRLFTATVVKQVNICCPPDPLENCNCQEQEALCCDQGTKFAWCEACRLSFASLHVLNKQLSLCEEQTHPNQTACGCLPEELALILAHIWDKLYFLLLLSSCTEFSLRGVVMTQLLVGLHGVPMTREVWRIGLFFAI